jgi:hypothetical protein
MAMLNNQRVSHNDAPNRQMWRVAYIWASATGRSITKSGPNPPKRSPVGLASPMGTLEVGVGVENSSGVPKTYGVLFHGKDNKLCKSSFPQTYITIGHVPTYG